MSGIRILLKGGQSIDFRGISLEEFVEEFTNRKGDVLVIGSVEGLKLALRWSEIVGAVDLERVSKGVDFRRWISKYQQEINEKYIASLKRKVSKR